jgi:hypothetical protein
MSLTSNEDTNIANTNTARNNQSEQQQEQQQESTQQDSGQTTVAGQEYTVDSTIKHRRRQQQQLDEQNKSPDPSLRGQQETDISNTNTITTGADPAAVARGIPPPQQQRLKDNEQPENQE